MKLLKIVTFITGISSLAFIIPVFLFYYHAKRILGYFPYYNNPDPKTLPFEKNYEPYINYGFIFWGLCLLLWLITSIALMLINRNKIIYKPILPGIFFHLLSINLLFSDIMEWIFD